LKSEDESRWGPLAAVDGFIDGLGRQKFINSIAAIGCNLRGPNLTAKSPSMVVASCSMVESCQLN
jgi:hypothetical protein